MRTSSLPGLGEALCPSLSGGGHRGRDRGHKNRDAEKDPVAGAQLKIKIGLGPSQPCRGLRLDGDVAED
jgi:hypothetical protein